MTETRIPRDVSYQLCQSIGSTDDPSTIRNLIEQNHLTNRVDAFLSGGWNGFTLMTFAANCGCLNVMKMLVNEFDANVNTMNEPGWTPLMWAAYHNELEIVKYLVNECHADLNVKCQNDYNPHCKDKTALELANMNNNSEIVTFLQSVPESSFLTVDPQVLIEQTVASVETSLASREDQVKYATDTSVLQYISNAKVYKQLTNEPQLNLPDVRAMDEKEIEQVTEVVMTVGLDVDYDSFNTDLACTIADDFARAANVPRECVEIVSVSRGSSIVEIRVNWSKCESTSVQLQMVYENLKSDEAKEILNTMNAFMVMCGHPEKHEQTPVDAMKKQMMLHAKWNRMYGKGHTFWEGVLNDGRDRGGKPYFCPNGWKRFSVHVQGMTQEKFDKKYANWAIGYHGTNFQHGASILLSGLLPALNNPGAGRGLYLTPSIVYVALPRYAEVKEITDVERQSHFGGGQYVQFALECRVDPAFIWKIGPETVGIRNAVQIDPNFSNDELEWIVEEREFYSFSDPDSPVVCTGIMLRVTDEHPQYLAESNWWAIAFNGEGYPNASEERPVTVLSENVAQVAR